MRRARRWIVRFLMAVGSLLVLGTATSCNGSEDPDRSERPQRGSAPVRGDGDCKPPEAYNPEKVAERYKDEYGVARHQDEDGITYFEFKGQVTKAPIYDGAGNFLTEVPEQDRRDAPPGVRLTKGTAKRMRGGRLHFWAYDVPDLRQRRNRVSGWIDAEKLGNPPQPEFDGNANPPAEPGREHYIDGAPTSRKFKGLRFPPSRGNPKETGNRGEHYAGRPAGDPLRYHVYLVFSVPKKNVAGGGLAKDSMPDGATFIQGFECGEPIRLTVTMFDEADASHQISFVYGRVSDRDGGSEGRWGWVAEENLTSTLPTYVGLQGLWYEQGGRRFPAGAGEPLTPFGTRGKCGERFVCPDPVQPQRVMVGGRGDQMVVGLRWRRWGGEEAEADGVARVNTCVPYCAAGRIEQPPSGAIARRTGARVELFRRRLGRCGGRPAFSYTRARVIWPDALEDDLDSPVPPHTLALREVDDEDPAARAAIQWYSPELLCPAAFIVSGQPLALATRRCAPVQTGERRVTDIRATRIGCAEARRVAQVGWQVPPPGWRCRVGSTRYRCTRRSGVVTFRAIGSD